ncbi:MAG: DUF2971 domain-containing protein [Oscillospiraceae bacterium]|nr:DUF2971 domain-containing protein [Oscillospiraceae bacterium]
MKEFMALLKTQKYEDAFSIKNNHIPAKLFRYRPFPANVKDSEYVINELMHKYVYLATVEQMDDSSDGFVKIDIYRIFEEVYGYKGLGDALLEDLFRQLCVEITESRKVMAHAGIRYCSFCEGENIDGDYIPSNDLLWGQYAAGGRGICIEYDMTKFNSNGALQRRFMYPIIYSDSHFDATDMFISYATGNTRSVVGYDILAHMIKREIWRNQNEWRLIYGSGIIAPDNPCILFDAISAVYIGVRAADEVRNVILRNADSIGAPIYEMKESLNGLKRSLLR